MLSPNISKAAANEIQLRVAAENPLLSKQESYLSVIWLSGVLVIASHCLHPLLLFERWECSLPCVYSGLQVLGGTGSRLCQLHPFLQGKPSVPV